MDQNELTNRGVSLLKAEKPIRNLKQYCRVRQNRIYAKDLCSCSEDYKKAEHETMERYESLKQLLTEDQGQELLLLINAGSTLEIISNSVFYKQGIMDGLKFVSDSLVILLKKA